MITIFSVHTIKNEYRNPIESILFDAIYSNATQQRR